MAVNCCTVPTVIAGSAGVTTIEASTAAVTFSDVVFEMAPDVAVAVVAPMATLAATPWALMAETVLSAVLHATVFVMSSVLPSV